MNQEHFKTVEINGIKMEVDMRNARVLENYKIGDPVKVLVKSYGDDYKTHAGIIVGFDEFKELPTIVVAYIAVDYSSTELKFAYLNKKTTGIEICPANKMEVLIDKSEVCAKIDREIEKKGDEIKELRLKKSYFLKNFEHYFSQMKHEETVQ